MPFKMCIILRLEQNGMLAECKQTYAIVVLCWKGFILPSVSFVF